MCEKCGCSNRHDPDAATGHDHGHDHGHDTGHTHRHAPLTRAIGLPSAGLSENDRLAERNRGFFEGKGVVLVDLVSAPGSGRGALVARTLTDRGGQWRFGLIRASAPPEEEGGAAMPTAPAGGVPEAGVTLRGTYHLDAHQVMHARGRLDLNRLDVVLALNGSQLVGSELADIGAVARVVMYAVTDGEYKPRKHPAVFRTADLVLIGKADLAEAVQFDRAQALEYLHGVAPEVPVIELSVKTGQGLDDWYAWLAARVKAMRA